MRVEVIGHCLAPSAQILQLKPPPDVCAEESLTRRGINLMAKPEAEFAWNPPIFVEYC